ncbi:hypothetical protein JCM17961_04590 [Endothiovibrio diazotrophicus]
MKQQCNNRPQGEVDSAPHPEAPPYAAVERRQKLRYVPPSVCKLGVGATEGKSPSPGETGGPAYGPS